MASSASIQLQIGNAVPSGDENDTRAVIELWHQVDKFFTDLGFEAQNGINGEVKPYDISLNAADVISTLEQAKQQSKSLTAHQVAHIDNPANRINASLTITIASEDHKLSEEESYQVATVLIQQLVIAMNLLRPGSIQLLGTRFQGESAHRYEAQNFDSRIFYGALRGSATNNWPELQPHALPVVWSWLESCATSKTEVAIKSINKVLFTLLKVAEQRHEYSARTALLVMYQLEVLLDCRQPNSLGDVRHRTALALGHLPDATEWLSELHDIRNDLFMASQPVHRPPLICHSTGDALREQFGQYPSAVELGTALVIALLQDLIAHQAHGYSFAETLSRV